MQEMKIEKRTSVCICQVGQATYKRTSINCPERIIEWGEISSIHLVPSICETELEEAFQYALSKLTEDVEVEETNEKMSKPVGIDAEAELLKLLNKEMNKTKEERYSEIKEVLNIESFMKATDSNLEMLFKYMFSATNGIRLSNIAVGEFIKDEYGNSIFLRRELDRINKSDRFITSFVTVGDVIEVEHNGELRIYKVEKFEVISNSTCVPTEFVIHVKFSYNNGISSTECTSDKFKYVRHISYA